MEQIKMVGLDIASSVFRLVERPKTAENFPRRLVSLTGSQCLFLATSGCLVRRK